jgi:hypothetical protein
MGSQMLDLTDTGGLPAFAVTPPSDAADYCWRLPDSKLLRALAT